MITPTLYRSLRGLFMVFFFALAACTSAPVTPPDTATEQPQTAQDWLNLAGNAPAEKQAEYRLNAAALYQQQGQSGTAIEVLRSIPAMQLQGKDAADYLVLAATLIEDRDGSPAALDWLTADGQQALLHRAPPSQQARVLAAQADLQYRTGDYLASATTRMGISAGLDDHQALVDNQDAIWLSLTQLPTLELKQALADDPAPLARGWYELALAGRILQGDIANQLDQVDRWQQRWPTHPATLQPPGDIELLRQLAENRPARVAVLLPLQGQLKKAGYAIRDGMLSAHFAIGQTGAGTPELSFYDTEANPDMAALYRQVVAEGAELIIGPLTRTRVEALLQSADGTVPVLALNYGSMDRQTAENTYQLGLSNADDARVAAERAAALDYRRAIVIHGADKQGVRTAEAFQQAWQALDGETVAVVEFDSERSASELIKQGLNVDLSLQRARRLESITGTSLEYNPRRRQDIDFVYLPVASQQARSIKPLLAFHFAEDLPVFATSRVYRGKADPDRDADLNGVYFCDTPWALGAVPEQQQRIEQYIEAGGAPSKNLYALGIDAYQLGPRLPQLLYSPNLRFYGTTGELSLSGEGVVQRRPAWAVFRGGTATLLKEPANESKEAIATGDRDRDHHLDREAI